MRAFLFSLLALLPATDVALAQSKSATKSAAPPANETRYFTAIDGFMDGADVILKEKRQGKTVTSAELDVCYSPSKTSDRRDRFVVTLTPNGQALTGTTQTLGGKAPVSVSLQQRPNGETFDFKGVIGIGTATHEITSTAMPISAKRNSRRTSRPTTASRRRRRTSPRCRRKPSGFASRSKALRIS